jgi:hypothetical protein
MSRRSQKRNKFARAKSTALHAAALDTIEEDEDLGSNSNSQHLAGSKCVGIQVHVVGSTGFQAKQKEKKSEGMHTNLS